MNIHKLFISFYQTKQKNERTVPTVNTVQVKSDSTTPTVNTVQVKSGSTVNTVKEHEKEYEREDYCSHW